MGAPSSRSASTAGCRPKPAWATAEEWARSAWRAAPACRCLFVAENVDAAHDEAGFATAGTHRRLEHAAEAMGLDPRALWRSADDALTRQLAAEQSRFQSEKGAKTLSRWATPFCADLAFTADGRAYLYENHLFPTWKRPGYFHAIAVDRGNNLGAYSALALGMSRLLVDGTAASALHKQVVAPLRMAREQEDEALDFLETQGAAAALGFRRAWPSEAPDPVLEKVLDGRDVEFGRRLAAAGLLLLSLDARTEAPAAGRQGDLWGGPSAAPGPSRWAVARAPAARRERSTTTGGRSRRSGATSSRRLRRSGRRRRRRARPPGGSQEFTFCFYDRAPHLPPKPAPSSAPRRGTAGRTSSRREWRRRRAQACTPTRPRRRRCPSRRTA